MIQRFVIHQPSEESYRRTALFAVELLDALTLSRVSDGVEVVAEGLRRLPLVNSGGIFVWRTEDLALLRRLRIEPVSIPYEPQVIDRAQLKLPPDPRPLTTVALSPRADYPFPSGTTGVRGRLVETRLEPAPVRDAEIALRWLSEDGTTWRDAPIVSRTTPRGDFVSVLRLTAADTPLSTNAAVTVRVRARRDGMTRQSIELKVPQGRVADPTTLSALDLAWDELRP